MELLLVALVALGFGALATCLLATRLPDSVHANAQDHGRYAGLGQRPAEPAYTPLALALRQPGRHRFGARRSRIARHAHPARKPARPLFAPAVGRADETAAQAAALDDGAPAAQRPCLAARGKRLPQTG